MIVDPSISQPQAIPTMGVRSSQDIVDHLDRVLKAQPPEVQAAVDHAHGIMGLQSPVVNADAGASGSPMAAPIASPAPVGPDPIAASPAGVSPIVAAGSPTDAQPLPTPKMIGVTQADLSSPAPSAANAPFMGGIADSAPKVSAPSAPSAPAAIPNPHMENLERMTKEGTGTNKIHNPFLRGLATAGDSIYSGLFPEFARFTPGTASHHQQLIGEEEGQLGQEQKATKATDESRLQNAQAGEAIARTAGIPVESELKHAEAVNYISEADARKNPDLQVVSHPVIDPADPSKTPRTGYFNKKTGVMTYGPEVAAAPVNKTPTNEMEKFFADNPKATSDDWEKFKKDHPAVVKFSAEDAALLRSVGGDPDKPASQTLDVMKKYEELKKTKPPTVNVNQGTWTIQEDAEGKPIEYNSKTGETRAVAAGGVQKAGTKEKRDAAAEKIAAPARDALQYAEDYGKKPPTGPGDEALMEKFFELAKPSSGFRMTQAQIDMLKHAQGWMNGATAYLHHATTGTWFSDDLRNQIIGTMQDLAKAKVSHLTGGAQHGADQLHGGVTAYVDNGTSYDIPADKVAAFEAKHPNAKKQ